MICVYPREECCSQVKDFLAILGEREIFHVVIYRNNKLGLSIKDQDLERVLELSVPNQIAFHGRIDSVVTRKGSFVVLPN